ncbi:ricin-type beta-trefoil lectin domain protein [Chitinimonas koreensis]|nr:ricin-type beta-trefoil lectin domain protein [Chitinimonas koreensis]
MVAGGKRVIVKSANAVYDGRTVWDGRLFAYGADGGWNSRQVKFADANACTLNGQAIVPGGQFYTVSDSKLAKEVLPDAWVDETGTIDAGNIPGLLACGINIVDADRWDDGLFRAAVWNWADGEPNNAGNAEHCAQARGDGRWNDLGCGAGLRYACRSEANADDWRVTVARGAWQDGAARCAAEFPGFRFAVPATPWQNRKLRAALGGGEAWLAYSDQAREGEWQDYAYRAAEWRADAAPQRYGSLQLPGATAVKVKVQGSVTLAADGLRIYDSARTLRATLGGYIGLREFTIEDGGVIVEYLGAGVAAPNYLTVTIEPAAAAPQPPAWRKLANGKGKCLDLEDRATGNGTRIHHWSCHGADSQLWWYDEQGRLHPKAAPGKCADASGAGTAKGTPIVLWDCNGGANQRWLRGANASFRVSNAPDKALDIKDSAWGAFDGQDAHLWDAHGGWSQQWNWQ